MPIGTPIDRSIKDTVKEPNGRDLVIIRISYPTLQPQRHLFSRRDGKACARFLAFYKDAAEGFETFARRELTDKARQNPTGTPPCGAVLRWHVTKDEKEALGICVEGSVFDGTDVHPIPPDVRVWDRKTGFLLQAEEKPT